MAYSEITTLEVTSGKAVKSTLTQKVKNNFDDHEERLNDLEVFQNYPHPLVFEFKGVPVTLPYTGAATFRVWTAITLTSARIFVVSNGTSGTVEVDIEKSAAGGGAFSSIFSTRPSVVHSDGDYALSSNGVLSTTSLVAGEILRVDIESIQAGMSEFQVILTYTVNS